MPIFSFAGDDSEAIIKKVQKKYESFRDLAISFKQHVRFGVTKSEQSFGGKIFIKKGNKYRIDMDQQTIVTDGKSVWSYNKVNDQLLIDNYREDPKSLSPDKILVTIPKNYSAASMGDENIDGVRFRVMKLTPKAGKLNFKWIKLWIDREDWLMKKVEVFDASENLMTYTIQEINFNSGLPDEEFQFKASDSTNVIDLR